MMYSAQLLILALSVARGVLAAPIHQFSDPNYRHDHGLDKRKPTPIHQWSDPDFRKAHGEERRKPLAIGELENGTPIQGRRIHTHPAREPLAIGEFEDGTPIQSDSVKNLA